MPLSPAELRHNTTEPLNSGGDDRPPFFDIDDSSAPVETGSTVELRTGVPNVQLLRGQTHQALHGLFKKRVRWNEWCLDRAYVNDHSFAHMDRVAAGVYHLGHRLGIDHDDLTVATLATRFHDIGYDFPPDADDALIAKMGKDMHTNHAQIGADLFIDALEYLRREEPQIQREAMTWQDRHLRIAHDSIRLHSNGSGVSDEELLHDSSIEPVSLLPRLIDKLDNVQSRVRPSHINAFAQAPAFSIRGIRQRVQEGMRHTLSDLPRDRRRKSKSNPRDALQEVDPYFFHRLAPLAITDQSLSVAHDGAMTVRYTAHPSMVSSALQMSYTNDDHLKDFIAAYDRSMDSAASVIHALRKRLYMIDAPADPVLQVQLQYEDSTQHVLQYEAS